ncbi:MAG: LysR family transcriptional regulator [Firmicutes bacterium HGW-Firmicutes-7]|nr:MAG: LysR family transcriptional regulator [Firmicutes bacterium HGW-Firmicutes-7]
MHIDSLKYFIDVVQEKSISKVAQKMHISQSALSQHIQKLEEDFGHKLLIRSNKGVEVTEIGEIVLKYSNNILRNYEKMFIEIKAYGEDNNRICINGTSALVAYSLPCVIYKIKKKFPNYIFEMSASTVEQLIVDIQNDICDFGFIDAKPDDIYNLYSYKMGKERVVLIAPPKYKISDVIKLEDLLGVDLINCTMNSQTATLLERELEKINKSSKDLKIIFNVDSISAVKSSVTNGHGVAFVPYEAIKHELYEKAIKIVDIENVNFDYDIYLISKRMVDLAKAAKESLEYLIEIGRKSFC